MPRTIDQIREKITPEQWLQGLRAARETWEGQLTQLIVDRDVLEASSTLPVTDREAVIERMETQIIEIDARIEEIDERLNGARDGALGLPRVARRRLAKEKAAKNGAKAEV